MQNLETSIYFDANASEPVRKCVIDAMISVLKVTGNPSSIHSAGRRCYHFLEDARENLAACFGGSVQNYIFTSGGTEANVLGVYGQLENRPLWVGATEHPAILNIDHSKKILPVNQEGLIDIIYLESQLQKPGIPPLVCLMLVNNVTGVIHPIRQISELCQRYGALLHVDAVQAGGKVNVNIEELKTNSLAFSAHKMGGPKGAGCLLLRSSNKNFAKPLTPLFIGGEQEQGRRGGTQALPAIVGMAMAAQEACNQSRNDILFMRNEIEKEVKKLGAIICGEKAPRVDNTSCIAFPGVSAQRQVMALDMAGFCVSIGSACSSGKVKASSVLQAMGLGDLSNYAIRVSLPWNVKPKQISQFIDIYRKVIANV